MLQDDDGQVLDAHSISAGLDYPGVGPEHAWLKDIGRAEYRLGDRQGSPGHVPAVLAARGHHPRARAGARARAHRGRREGAGAGGPHRDEHVRAGGQGRVQRCEGVGGGGVGRHSIGTTEDRRTRSSGKDTRLLHRQFRHALPSRLVAQRHSA